MLRSTQSGDGNPKGIRFILQHLGWFTSAYSTIVGGPSVLAILQEIFKSWRLSPSLQWIVDGYHKITGWLGYWVEPYVLWCVKVIAAILQTPISLDPLWRPVFLLLLIPVVGQFRGVLFHWSAKTVVHEFPSRPLLKVLLQIPIFLVVAAVASISLVDAGLLYPVLSTYLVAFMVLAGDGLFRIPRGNFLIALAPAGLALVLSFFKTIAMHAIIVSVGTFILVIAVLRIQLSHDTIDTSAIDRRDFVASLSVMGGFLTAALIVIADIIIKLAW